ncbi:MAG: UDP-N-acetylmuramoyl-L-alanine--D-glutamate ligase, partial [Thermoanaerobaculia bacterium]|nr:UDP-N-acetylmuramoyl-L-alanine--D-glutamate ligase [Thermoanaerobaculia bacterium]
DDAGVECRLGDEPRTVPTGVDGVVLSPGVPRSRPLVDDALRRGIPVVAEVELAFPFLDGDVIGITGSNGKSTTASLVAEILRCADLPGVLCGNIGEPLSSKIEGPEGRIFVVELSSFQLESVVRFRAHAAALLNVSPDHMDRYPSLAAYAAAKERIFERQGDDDTAVFNADDAVCARAATRVEKARVRYFSRRNPVADGCWSEGGAVLEAEPGAGAEEVFRLDEIRLPGTANLENAMAATLLARACGAARDDVRRAVAGFAGLPHRLQHVADLDGVAWYDDSKGTNVGATLQSLAGFDDGSVHVILGGRSKGADFTALADVVGRKAVRAYLVGESASEIREALGDRVPVEAAGTLERAVRAAAAAARAGEVVVLSPACASFDQFASFEDRGRRFQALVATLAEGGDG